MVKQLSILSGKGGTGKTTISAIFSVLASKDGVIIADADVDAPNLHILLQPHSVKETHFYRDISLSIVPESCTSCGLCYELCRFDAIMKLNHNYEIDKLRCEKCALCYHVCPAKAIKIEKDVAGRIFVSQTKYGTLIHALLNPGQENSGKLVLEVRERAQRYAEVDEAQLILLDGPTGIGCPVIASLTGADLVLVVTEPTLSGFRDLQRILKLIDHFGVETIVVVNRYDLNEAITQEIIDLCFRKNIEVNMTPFDEKIPFMQSRLKIPLKGEAFDALSNNP